MPNPLKIRDRLLARDSSSDESGFVLIFVLILSVALLTMLTFAVTSSVGNLDNAANYGNSAQAQNSAMAGLSIATDQMTTAKVPANLPCSVASTSMLVPQVRNTNDTYRVVIVYSVAGVTSTCTGPGAATYGTGAPPTSAVLTSTGTTAHTTPVTMQETMLINATSSLLGAFTYATFSQDVLTLQNGLTINSPSSCIGPDGSSVPAPCGNVYGGTLDICKNSPLINGNVQAAQTLAGNLTMGNSCEVTGDLYVNGSVTLNNNAKVDGNIYAYGGNVTLNDSTSVGKNIYATAVTTAGVTVGGTVNIDTKLQFPIVGRSLYAANTVTAKIGGITQTVISSTVAGTLSGVSGSVNFPWSGSVPTAPPPQTFPPLGLTTINPATLAAYPGDAGVPPAPPDPYTVIPIGGTNLDGTIQPACSTFQAFVTPAVPYPAPTAIYAPTCVVSLNGNSTFNLNNNEIWVVGGFSAGGGLNFQSGVSGKTFDLSVVVDFSFATCPAGDISLNGNTFATSIKVLLYTPCDVNLTGDQTINGQILAGGTFSTNGNLTLTFDQSGLAYLPGAYGAPVLTLTVTGKTVING